MWLPERRREAGPFCGWYVVGTCFCIAVFGWGLGFYGPGPALLALTRDATGSYRPALAACVALEVASRESAQ
jgi:hypothetical protein